MTRFPPIDVRHPRDGDIVTDSVHVAGFVNIADSVAVITVRGGDDTVLATADVRSLDFGSGDFGVTLDVTPTSALGNVVVGLAPDLEAAVVPVTFGSALFGGAYLGFEVYTVIGGDTLPDIATKFYSDASKWTIIATANRDIVSDPDEIFPGQELRIPIDPTAV